jgi:hypothetical protein
MNQEEQCSGFIYNIHNILFPRNPKRDEFSDSNSLEIFSFLDILKMSNFHFCEIVSESEVFKKHVHSIML